jgi:hypothetical protein
VGSVGEAGVLRKGFIGWGRLKILTGTARSGRSMKEPQICNFQPSPRICKRHTNDLVALPRNFLPLLSMISQQISGTKKENFLLITSFNKGFLDLLKGFSKNPQSLCNQSDFLGP